VLGSSRLPGYTQLKPGANETSFSLTPRFNGVSEMSRLDYSQLKQGVNETSFSLAPRFNEVRA